MRQDGGVLVEAGSDLGEITVEETIPGWEECENPAIRIWQWDEYNCLVIERARIPALVDALQVFATGS